MEAVILVAVVLATASCMASNLFIAYMLWQHWCDRKAEPIQPVLPEETPEEKEARRAAAEAQAKYEQGFVNMMSYMGIPVKKERDFD